MIQMILKEIVHFARGLFFRLLDFAVLEDELCIYESDKIFVERALHVQLLGYSFEPRPNIRELAQRVLL